MGDDKMTIHEIIKSYRIASQLSQEQMAEKMHMTEQTYARWENGKTKMTNERLELFAKTIGKTANEIRDAVKEGHAINLLNADIHDSNDAQKVVINNYYGETELSLEIQHLKNLLAEKDKQLIEKEKVIISQAEQIGTLKAHLELLQK